MPISFVHTADVHFGMENYGRIDPSTGMHTRLLDFDRAMNHAIDTAIARNVDFFLLAGDAYKTAVPSPTHQRLLMRCLLRLYAANIPVVIVVGNHDKPISFGKAHALSVFGDLPVKGFYLFSKPDSIVLETKNGPVQIVGIPWPTRATIALAGHQQSTAELTQQLSQAVNIIVQEFAQKLDPSIPAVLTGHLTVSSGIFSGSEKRAIYGNDPVLMPSQLAIEPFDYVALGHLHRHQNLNMNGKIPLVYAGSIERVDFGERKEDKGFCVVTIDQVQNSSNDHNRSYPSTGSGRADQTATEGTERVTTYEFMTTPMRPFIQLEIELDAQRSHTDQIIQQIKAQDIEGAVLKILYHVKANDRDLVDLSAIERACLGAQHLVGIIPIRHHAPRERRAVAHVNMDLPTLLGNYFDTKPELAAQKDVLIQKTMDLEAELMNADG